jgi:hypothetical protein
MTNVAGTPSGARLKLNFTYDWQGRRIQKVVSAWNGTGAYVPQYTNKFGYNGWNLIAEFNCYGTANSATLARSYLWGSDLSGTMQGAGLPRQSGATAGGVGGLIAIKDSSLGTHFAAFDGNGNVAVLVNAADGTNSAVYEYGPFGELLRATGPMAKANPFRFSTKYQDDETDLLYYGYHYCPVKNPGKQG